jgi:hypothetical protein
MLSVVVSPNFMHRVTARLLLLLLLVSVLAPAALALSTTDPHVCCRRVQPNSRQPELLNLPQCCQRGNCSLPLSVFLWGGVAPQAAYLIGPALITAQRQRNPIHRAAPLDSSPSVRGPPMFFPA